MSSTTRLSMCRSGPLFSMTQQSARAQPRGPMIAWHGDQEQPDGLVPGPEPVRAAAGAVTRSCQPGVEGVAAAPDGQFAVELSSLEQRPDKRGRTFGFSVAERVKRGADPGEQRTLRVEEPFSTERTVVLLPAPAVRVSE